MYISIHVFFHSYRKLKKEQVVCFIVCYLNIKDVNRELRLSVYLSMSNYTDYLKELYYTPGKPGAFAGPEKLYQAVKQGNTRLAGGELDNF